jgi:hypothetical protein
VAGLFRQYYETALAATSYEQLRDAAGYFSSAVIGGLLDILGIIAGGAALTRLRVLRSQGKLTVGAWLEAMAQWGQQLWARLRSGGKMLERLLKGEREGVKGKAGKGKPTTNHIQPSNSPDPKAKPRGPRTQRSPNDRDPTNKRSADGEDRAADVLAQYGYDVEQVPPSKQHGKKQADYKVEGKDMDCVTPAKNTSNRNIWDRVREKVDLKQTNRVVLNLEDWSGDVAALKKQFADWPIEGLEEVIIITKQGSVQHIFP